MRIKDVFQINGSKHDVLTTIRFDRKLSEKERICRTAVIGDITLSLNPTTSDELMWTPDEIQNPKSLIGKEIILL